MLVTGGVGSLNTMTATSPTVLDTAEVYDPAAGVFLPIAKMKARRDRQFSVRLEDGRVLIGGGADTLLVPMILFPGPPMPSTLGSTEIFDPAAGTFTLAATMIDARDEPTGTLLPDGKVLVAGGGDVETELYDPAANKFTATGKMNSARFGQTATLTADGLVLMVGGGTADAEIYNPATGKFATVGAMSTDRIYHTATLLEDGRVLVAGGSPYARRAPLDTTDLYDPKSGKFSAGPKM
ncbi:MAG: kelch repeat-containing protein, partial [Candidatus Binataceae bacterium]